MIQVMVIGLLADSQCYHHPNELIQERRNSIANTLELCLSCINPSIWCH